MANENFVGRGDPLTQQAFDAAAQRLGCGGSALWALMTVETCGFGFLSDRRPKILFERHVFHKRTGGRHSKDNPDISARTRGGYTGGGASEYRRLENAMRLDRRAALESASWGLPQIMGFNAAALRYEGAEDMVAEFLGGEDAQLDGAIRFIQSNPALEAAIRNRIWQRVAYLYNGPAYAKNGYHTKLAHYCDRYTAEGLPSMEVRAAQAHLTFLGFDPHGVDGIVGPGTRAALTAFQKSRVIPMTAEFDSRTMEELSVAARRV